MNNPLVFLSINGHGEFLPLAEARIPVLDRGFIFGDGVYEVVPVYQRVPFRIDQHLARLGRSLAAIEIANPHDSSAWKKLIQQLITSFDQGDQIVYIQVTRGVAKRAHAFPQDAVPTILMMTNPLVLPTQVAREHGVAVVTAVDNRWSRCDIKATSLLGNVLMAQHAAQHGVAETIMFREGFLTEGSSSNVWIVKDGVLLGPPRDRRILEGIRCALLEELAEQSGIRYVARPISQSEVHAADEIMLSSATKEILAVTKCDNKSVGAGIPGPVYRTLYQAYQANKQQVIAAYKTA